MPVLSCHHSVCCSFARTRPLDVGVRDNVTITSHTLSEKLRKWQRDGQGLSCHAAVAHATRACTQGNQILASLGCPHHQLQPRRMHTALTLGDIHKNASRTWQGVLMQAMPAQL